jgi:hypothetical protein
VGHWPHPAGRRRCAVDRTLANMQPQRNLDASARLEILDLYARYCYAADDDDVVAYGDCFTDDGSLVADGVVVGAGRQALRAMRGGQRAERAGAGRRHFISNVTLEPGGDVVRGRCYLMAVNLPGGREPEITHVGVYEDEVVLEEEAWRFRRRHLRTDFVRR